ncbi:DUF6434 domain-containing protein [Gellertiella hungarica]|uniref:DUF6434 domain-containing protein n=1 Tax=Gellertiella hungarica TaxID=1572859 RepID=A0A7W6J995_9HYPH|nr:DUF6434 domain-containing protein [Gellertiella hungarica]MBB4067155.1 hypothetical protein [Gellertiella hungarica]
MGHRRPDLTRDIGIRGFNAWYWLKAELTAFCRAHALPGSGSKEELQQRIRAFLAGATPTSQPTERAPASRASLPDDLTPATVIGTGWKLCARLRAFFVLHLGHSFRFNQGLRDLFRNPAGATLDDALRLYRASKATPSVEIGPQFQYNQHLRAYFAANPAGTREEAIRLWRERRLTGGAIPHSDRPLD